MAHPNASNVGLFTFPASDGPRTPVVPTRLGVVIQPVGDYIPSLDSTRQLIGAELEARERLEEQRKDREGAVRRSELMADVVSNFKAELWQFTPGEMDNAKAGDFQNMQRRPGDPRAPWKVDPRDAIVSFLGLVLENVISGLRQEEAFKNARYQVHVSRPVREQTKEKARYQRHFREYILPKLKGFLESAGIPCHFPGESVEFPLEPHSVYQLVSRVHGLSKVPDGEEPTYLIVDIGGATTDLTVIQEDPKKGLALPLNEGLEVAGNAFDKILLRHLRIVEGEPLSEKDIEDLLKLEDPMRRVRHAKERVSRGEEPGIFRLRERQVTLTPEGMNNAFEIWWDKIEKAIYAITQRAQAREDERAAKLKPFERFHAVVFAGGMSQLPQLRSYVAEDNDFGELIGFPIFSNRASASTLTAQGMALELTPDSPGVPALVTAEYIVGRFVAEEIEAPLEFYRREKPAHLVLPKNYIASIDEIQSGKVFKYEDFRTREYKKLRSKLERGSKHISLELRTDISEKWEDAGKVLLNPPPRNEDRFGYRFKAFRPFVESKSDGTAYLGYDHHSDYGCVTKGDVRNGATSLGKSNPNTHVRLPLTRVKADVGTLDAPGDVHICVDMGMTNTAVAVYAPGRPLPRGIFDEIEDPFSGKEDKSGRLREPIQVDLEEHREYAGDGSVDGTPEPVEVKTDEAKETEDVTLERPAIASKGDHLTAETSAVREKDGAPRTGEQEIASVEQKEVVEEMIVSEAEARNEIRPIPPSTNRGDVKPEVPVTAWSNRTIETLVKEIEAFRRRLEDAERKLDQQPDGRIQSASYKDIAFPGPSTNASVDILGCLGKRFEFVGASALRSLQTHIQERSPHLILLTGPPGTGKSSLAREVASLINSDKEAFELIPVSPTWFDHTSLLGGASDFGGFHETPFARLLIRAWRAHHQHGAEAPRYVACFDEINLAHPEQYLAPLLVAMEADKPEDRRLDIRGFEPLEEDAEVLYFPPNLTLFGTLNLDATTKTLSPKLLDRALLIRMIPNKDRLKDAFVEAYSSAGDGRDTSWHDTLRALLFESEEDRACFYDVAREAGSPFGFRAVKRAGLLIKTATEYSDLDHILCAVFLSKLPGATSIPGLGFGQRLGTFMSRLDEARYPEASAVAGRILKGLPGQFA